MFAIRRRKSLARIESVGRPRGKSETGLPDAAASVTPVASESGEQAIATTPDQIEMLSMMG